MGTDLSPVSQELPLGQVPYCVMAPALLICSQKTSSLLPTRERAAVTKPGSIWVFPQASETVNSFLHRDTDSTGRWSNSQISG